jgi:hypothetical protein
VPQHTIKPVFQSLPASWRLKLWPLLEVGNAIYLAAFEYIFGSWKRNGTAHVTVELPTVPHVYHVVISATKKRMKVACPQGRNLLQAYDRLHADFGLE